MFKVSLSKKAIKDLDEIWLYTFNKWSESQADIYYNAIKRTCTRIGKKPKTGKKYFKLEDEIWGIKSGKHIIFYRKKSKSIIEIIRILHERMDLISRIQE